MAGAVYDVARPFGWLTVVNPGGVYLGSMEHHLGVLAATSGAADVAAGHFDAAVEAHRVAGADEWVERSRVQRGAIETARAWRAICLGCGVRVRGGHRPSRGSTMTATETPPPPPPPPPASGDLAARAVRASKVYGAGDTEVRALDDVTVEFERGRSPPSWARPARASRR